MRLWLAMGLLVSLESFASGPFTNRELDKVCRGPRVYDGGNGLLCVGAENAAEVRGARVGENTKVPPVVASRFVGAFELGVLPDADTDLIYGFTRRLLDKNDRLA